MTPKPVKKQKMEIQGRAIEVEVATPTFFDVQSLAPLFVQDNIDLAQYWMAAFNKWLQFSEPVVLTELTVEEGLQLQSFIPDPVQVIEWLSFREAKSPA